MFDFQGSRITPPGPPFARGGKGSLATSFHRAQQEHASPNRPSSSVKTNFAACQGYPDEYPKTMKIRFDEELPLWNYRAIPGKCDN